MVVRGLKTLVAIGESWLPAMLGHYQVGVNTVCEGVG